MEGEGNTGENDEISFAQSVLPVVYELQVVVRALAGAEQTARHPAEPAWHPQLLHTHTGNENEKVNEKENANGSGSEARSYANPNPKYTSLWRSSRNIQCTVHVRVPAPPARSPRCRTAAASPGCPRRALAASPPAAAARTWPLRASGASRISNSNAARDCSESRELNSTDSVRTLVLSCD